MKIQKSKISAVFLSLLVISGYQLRTAGHKLYAQDNEALVTLTKKIMEAKVNQDLYALFAELKDLYFKENKYNELIEFLKSLSVKKKSLEPFVNYYIALARYHQLKYLEETQDWDEYFSNGNAYREEIVFSTLITLKLTTVSEPLYLYTQLLLFQFHQDQQDGLDEQVLSDLMNSVSEYAKKDPDTKPIKAIADKLLSYGEKAKSKELYRLYVERLLTVNLNDQELKNIAWDFYQEGNLDLAESIYDVYIEKIKSNPKGKLIPILSDIARLFVYKDEGTKDATYAEKIFKRIEDICGKEAFNEELSYARAFNLEKAKEYAIAKDSYLGLIQRFSKTTRADEIDFKIGLIYTYVLRDIKTGKGYFEKLAQKETLSPQVISSLYHLGLLNQWEEDLEKAKGYYNKLLEKSGDNFMESVALAKERLKEIEQLRPIEYNLKTFLDVSLKEENSLFDMSKSELKSSVYRPNKEKEINITAQTYTIESGCMQVEVEYLWSGHLGSAKPSLGEASFNTTYIQPGTKEINLVIVSPSGIIDRNIDIIDVDVN